MNGYEVYLGKLLLPVSPSKITVKAKNLNETAVMISGKEVNIPKPPGLREINITAMLPNTKLPFASYKNDEFKPVEEYINELADIKAKKKPFYFKIIRCEPAISSDEVRVLLEDYTVIEDANEGIDATVEITLREYVDYEIKSIATNSGKATAKKAVRERDNAPSAATHTVEAGDTLHDIALKYLGDGSRYKELYALNKDVMDKGNANTNNNRYTIYPEQVLRIPGVLGNGVSDQQQNDTYQESSLYKVYSSASDSASTTYNELEQLILPDLTPQNQKQVKLRVQIPELVVTENLIIKNNFKDELPFYSRNSVVSNASTKKPEGRINKGEIYSICAVFFVRDTKKRYTQEITKDREYWIYIGMTRANDNENESFYRYIKLTDKFSDYLRDNFPDFQKRLSLGILATIDRFDYYAVGKSQLLENLIKERGLRKGKIQANIVGCNRNGQKPFLNLDKILILQKACDHIVSYYEDAKNLQEIVKCMNTTKEERIKKAIPLIRELITPPVLMAITGTESNFFETEVPIFGGFGFIRTIRINTVASNIYPKTGKPYSTQGADYTGNFEYAAYACATLIAHYIVYEVKRDFAINIYTQDDYNQYKDSVSNRTPLIDQILFNTLYTYGAGIVSHYFGGMNPEANDIHPNGEASMSTAMKMTAYADLCRKSFAPSVITYDTKKSFSGVMSTIMSDFTKYRDTNLPPKDEDDGFCKISHDANQFQFKFRFLDTRDLDKPHNYRDLKF